MVFSLKRKRKKNQWVDVYDKVSDFSSHFGTILSSGEKVIKDSEEDLKLILTFIIKGLVFLLDKLKTDKEKINKILIKKQKNQLTNKEILEIEKQIILLKESISNAERYKIIENLLIEFSKFKHIYEKYIYIKKKN